MMLPEFADVLSLDTRGNGDRESSHWVE